MLPEDKKTVIDFFRSKPKSRTKTKRVDTVAASGDTDAKSHALKTNGSCSEPPSGVIPPPLDSAEASSTPLSLESGGVLWDEGDGREACENSALAALSHVRTKYISRQVLLNQYLEKTEPGKMNESASYRAGETSEIDECPDCRTERVLFQHDATLVCPNPKCLRTDIVLVDSHIPSYKESIHEGAPYYSYKRINHFNEWLAQFQAKESTDIPDDVYNRIFVELKKERISNMAVVSTSKMKEILRRLKLNKYYEHIPHIMNRINGQPAPVITRATEEKLRSMFKEIQGPFMKHCPPERKNFLSYSYVLHKFCQLLELDDYLQFFQLLKSREKLHVQDMIWEKICGELNWEFIKSV